MRISDWSSDVCSSDLSWPERTYSVCPASRCSRVSPTHRIGTSPAALAATNLRATSSLLSWWYWRRSEWPTSPYFAPTSAIIAAYTPPVSAPFPLQPTSLPPHPSLPPSHTSPLTSP